MRMSPKSVSADASGHEGYSATAVVVEHDLKGRIFHPDLYTSIIVGYEASDIDHDYISEADAMFDRFITCYRYLIGDARFPYAGHAFHDAGAIRIFRYRYSDSERRLPFEERIDRAIPDQLRPSIVALGRGAEALRDHGVDPQVLKDRAVQLGHHLATGFMPTENLIALERVADLAFVQKFPRPAVAEAMSLLELSILAERDRKLNTQNAGSANRDKNITWDDLLNKVLPFVLDSFDEDKAPLMRLAHEMVNLRHEVVHRGRVPTLKEVNSILSFVKHVISILELDDRYRKNWKRK